MIQTYVNNFHKPGFFVESQRRHSLEEMRIIFVVWGSDGGMVGMCTRKGYVKDFRSVFWRENVEHTNKCCECDGFPHALSSAVFCLLWIFHFSSL